MPTALRVGPYRFYFYSHDCDEPRHVHVDRESNSAKFWLEPIQLEVNYGFARQELRAIERIIEDNLEALKNEWNAYCGNRA